MHYALPRSTLRSGGEPRATRMIDSTLYIFLGREKTIPRATESHRSRRPDDPGRIRHALRFSYVMSICFRRTGIYRMNTLRLDFVSFG